MSGNKTISLYRGESCNYHENNEPFEPSIRRKLMNPLDRDFEHSHVVKMYEETKKHPMFSSISLKQDVNSSKNRFKRLAIMQHYGLGTPLIDVTTDRNIAMFFACSNNFDKNGYIYKFSCEQMKGDDTSTVDRRMKLIWDNSPSQSKGIKPYTYEKVFAFDYCSFFKTDSDCLRYSNQKGYFLLTGYDTKNDYKPLNIPFDLPVKEEIRSDEKIVYLFKLAIEGYSNVLVYPDQEDSLKEQRLFLDRDYLNIDDSDCWINKIVGDEELKLLLRRLRETLSSVHEFAFFNKNLKDYILSSKSILPEMKKMVVEQLIGMSN